MADAVLWLALARILAVLSIGRAKDSEGRPIEPSIQLYTGLSRSVALYICYDTLAHDTAFKSS